jgi:NADH-quinone oxidoreductase subunit F
LPEKKVVLRNCRVIDPGRIDSYLARDGFKALKKARDEMTPEQVIAEVKASGLRGRGGAGFPCGLKWELARKSQETEKYIIANADEGEMGTFKDRYILENDPFSLIEALAIAGYAVGAGKGYIYLRAEYHNLLDLITNAIKQAKQKGRLDFDIELREGAGAYVCGEETALMDSIEGKRGEIRYRPPYPPTKGLWQRPTVINNVETLMNIPPIILNGAGWFSGMGTAESKGTKVFSVSGDVSRPGVYELVMGSPLRELVEKLAQAERVRMVQVGGAGGRILPYAMIDTSLAYESILGAGAVIVLDESRDVIDAVYKSLEFMAEESCGKCAPCREGTEVMIEIMGRFWRGEGEARDLKILPELAEVMRLASLCGLGQTAPLPVIDSLQYFGGDYQPKIRARGGARV